MVTKVFTSPLKSKFFEACMHFPGPGTVLPRNGMRGQSDENGAPEISIWILNDSPHRQRSPICRLRRKLATIAATLRQNGPQSRRYQPFGLIPGISLVILAARSEEKP